MAAPFVVRWRNAVMDDPNLSARAKAAAMPLARHADTDGKNCYPGAARCAREMSVDPSTIKRGWGDLKAAGYLDVLPLPQGRRRTQGAVKVLRFPQHGGAQPPGSQRGGAQFTKPGAQRPSTSEGNREGSLTQPTEGDEWRATSETHPASPSRSRIGSLHQDQENGVNADGPARFREANARPEPEPRATFQCAVDGCERSVHSSGEWCRWCKADWIEAHPESPAVAEIRRAQVESEARTLTETMARFDGPFHDDHRGDLPGDTEAPC